ncbi:DUF2306 domain-containing protein [Alkalihalobacillus sp. CinArs1]|uniref:DUF2306 domain-containing protein n=1 Tax=Alkalihalobacillus sp. CinArs1 TaxID=2995314 RepID=UPI0022DDBDE8|nr:DUF2306 domain-containing protein [Alkalihalobacillus sp. CinArs1]
MEVLLAVHILAGTICLITGIGAMVFKKRKGKHTNVGQVYHASYVLVFITAVLMAIVHWQESQYLFYIALFSYGLALVGFLSVKKKKSKRWLTLHIGGMLGSYIGIVTATLVVNVSKIPVLNELPTIYYWFLPTIIGTPIIRMVGQRYKAKKPRKMKTAV